MSDPVNNVYKDSKLDVWVHLKINEGRNFSSQSSKLGLSIRFMGWNRREVSLTEGSRPKWSLNTRMTPFPLEKFLQRVKDNYFVIQVQDGDSTSTSSGIALISLDPFYSAIETGPERFYSDNYPYPIIGFNDWIQVKDPLIPESSLGEINVQLTAGSRKQIDNFTKFYGYDPESQSLLDNESLEPSFSVSDSPSKNEETDFSVNITVLQGRNLPYLKDRPNPYPNSYVSFENKFFSSIQPESQTPSWNFSVSGIPLNPDKRYLIIRVWHSNSNTADEVLGFAAIDLFAQGDKFEDIHGWYNVMDFSGRLKGEINVQITAYKDTLSSPTAPIKQPQSKALTETFISNLRILEELSSNLKARLRLNNELNHVCHLDFGSIKSKDAVETDIPDLGDINWDEVMNVNSGEESRRTADGQSVADDQIKNDLN